MESRTHRPGRRLLYTRSDAAETGLTVLIVLFCAGALSLVSNREDLNSSPKTCPAAIQGCIFFQLDGQ